ncbi:hypothetical protein X777_02848 [Ooceraea biroi]|uniref:Uncharacterized protein n=1 Tax=Ooceraea biroi TaxID=2015173 RepID=A0A026WJQ1_OOCBI|nr:hypothetical protein X777_02848 [Ooceraea biroi]
MNYAARSETHDDERSLDTMRVCQFEKNCCYCDSRTENRSGSFAVSNNDGRLLVISAK